MDKNEPVIIDIKPVVESEPESQKLPKDSRPIILLGVLILVLGFGGFLFWALTAKLDEGVPVQGSMVVDSMRKTIQHQTGGIIDKILVHDGDAVKKGQVLIRLVDTQNKAAVDINTNLANTLKEQIASLSSQLEAVKPLLDEGYYPRNQYLEQQRQLLDLQRQREEALSKAKVAKEEEERTEIRSPVNGTVMGVSVFTVGGVIQPTTKIMEIEPAGEKLVVEVQIPTHLIDRIHAGLDADVRLTALNQRTTPVLSGVVQWVSADRFQDPQHSENSYYTARIRLSPDSLEKLKGETLQAGMPAEVIIKTGARTFWEYLIKPIKDRAALSLKER
jgi:protease secretion system membrane fusion protein